MQALRTLAPFLTAVIAGAIGMPVASAFQEPFYGRVEVQGDIGDPVAYAVGSDAGARSVSASAGSFWCSGTGWGCGVSIAPGAGGGAGVASVDPFAGTFRSTAGAFHYPGAEPVWWWVDLGYGPFKFYPPWWKGGATESYARQSWLIGSDTLAPGTPVTLQATLAVDGRLSGTGQAEYGAAMLVNTRAETGTWLFDEYVSYGTAQDLIGIGIAQGRALSGFGNSAQEPGGSSVPFAEVAVADGAIWSRDFVVGDVVVVETMLYTFVGAANVGGFLPQFDIFARFGQTLQSGVELTTPGAMLVAVPEPATWALWFSGLAVFGWLAQRRLADADRLAR